MSGSIVFAFTKGTPKEALPSSGTLIPLMALAIMLSINGAGTAHADGNFFFQDQAQPQRQRATFSDRERDRLLQEAYACNRPGKTPEEQQLCRAREARARQMISERTRANHRLAEQQIQELRRLYRQQPR
jgi:hypothetical protein